MKRLSMWLRSSLTTLLGYGLLGCFLVVERRLRQGQQATSLEQGQFDRHSTRWVGRAFLLSVGAMLLAPLLSAAKLGRIQKPFGTGWSGIILMLSGITLRTWANKMLGAFYTRTLRVTEHQQIVDRGPYRHGTLYASGQRWDKGAGHDSRRSKAA